MSCCITDTIMVYFYYRFFKGEVYEKIFMHLHCYLCHPYSVGLRFKKQQSHTSSHTGTYHNNIHAVCRGSSACYRFLRAEPCLYRTAFTERPFTDYNRNYIRFPIVARPCTRTLRLCAGKHHYGENRRYGFFRRP